MGMPLDILLATFEGAAFLPAQLDSLLGQTRRDFRDFRILARDDGSSDDTRAILARYAATSANCLTVLPSDGERLGAAGSFARLLGEARGEHVMFCDQDDVWLPDKTEVTLSAMRDLEGRYGASTPCLVCTDLQVVDDRLRVIDPSFWHFQRIHPERLDRLSRVLVQNFATGCTVMINRALAELALPVPPGAMMHDWWLALVATRFGRVRALPRATVLYRQHGRNDVGARRWSFWAGVERFFLHRERRQAALAEQERVYRALEGQAAAFAERFADRLSAGERAMLAAFGTFHARGFAGRRYLMLRHRFLQSDRWQAFMGLLR